MDEDRLKKAIKLAQQATDMDLKGDYENAFEFYKSSLDNWGLVCKYQTNPVLKERLYKKMEGYISRAEAIKEYLDSKKRSPPLPITSTVSNSDDDINTGLSRIPKASSSSTLSQRGNKDDERLQNLLSGVLLAEKPRVKWEDVAGLDAAKEALQEAVTLPTKFPNLFVGERKPWKGILLYGPPGTGKTHLAKACATEASASFFSVSSADLISKWQGESEKLVRALFETARQKAPSIVFIDEVDSLCGARNDRESESSRRVKTEFLVQMEGLETENGNRLGKEPKRVLVLGATNTPWSLDAGIRRRFERRIYIALPELRARKKMFSIHIGKTPNTLTDANLQLLAERTEGYSGADISVLVRDALFEPVRKCRLATHFKRVQAVTTSATSPSYFWTPSSPGDPDPTKEERSLMTIPGSQLLPPDLTMWDFEMVLSQSKPSTSPEELKLHREWTEKFGVDGC